jgi:GNAT superfamily N-acetyltransferase
MNIRPAVKNDLPEVGKLWLSLVKETYPDEKPSFEMMIQDTLFMMNTHPGYSMFVAEDGGEIVGFVDAVYSNDPVIGKLCGRARGLYVKPRYRSSLVGLELFKVQEAWGKQQGAKAAKGNCVASMVKIYESFGYKAIETLMYKKEL